MNWIKDLLKATDELEPPERYFYWSGLATISAILRRQVFMDRFSYILYPNIFVILMGGSGLRKALPVSYSRSMVERLDITKVISGRCSVQGATKELGKMITLESGGQLRNACGMLVSGEFAAYLVDDPKALTILTDLYDSHAHEKYKTSFKNQTEDTLVNVCVTMLSATNEVQWLDSVRGTAIGGGFLARTFLVQENKKRLLNSLMDRPKHLDLMNGLAKKLEPITKLEGPAVLDTEARTYFDAWYKKFNSIEYQDSTGTLARIHDQALKVSILLRAAECEDLVIGRRHIVEAIEKSLECYGAVKRVSSGTGGGSMAAQTKVVLDYLMKAPEYSMARKKLLQKGWGSFDSIDLDRVMETLTQMSAVIVERIGKDWQYTLTKKYVEAYESLED